MARDAEAEREKRAKIIAAEGEARAAAALGEASDTMMSHPLALQLRNLQTLAEPGVEKNTTVVFPAPLMSAIGELATFLAHESAAAAAGRSAGQRSGICADREVTGAARGHRSRTQYTAPVVPDRVAGGFIGTHVDWLGDLMTAGRAA